MLLRGLPIFMIAVLATAPALVLAQQPLPSGPDSYRTLLTRLQAKDTTIDFTALRLASTRDSGYAPYGSAAGVHWDSGFATSRTRRVSRSGPRTVASCMVTTPLSSPSTSSRGSAEWWEWTATSWTGADGRPCLRQEMYPFEEGPLPRRFWRVTQVVPR